MRAVNRPRLYGVVFAALLLPGCVIASDKPIYDRSRDTTFDPQLVGHWHLGELRIARGVGKSYRLISPATQPSDRPQEWTCDLVRIGKYQYLFPVSDDPRFSGTVLFPVYRVEADAHSLRLRLLNAAMAAKVLCEKPDELRHRKVPAGGLYKVVGPPTQPATTEPVFVNIVLTDEPERIRQFLIRHQDDEDWFAEEMVFTK